MNAPQRNDASIRPADRRFATAAALAAAVASVLFAATLALAAAAPSGATVVALAAATVPERIENPAPLAATIESALADALRAQGFEVVPSTEFEAAWSARVRAAGGYFDVVNGKPDLAKRRALRLATLADLGDRRGVGALLVPHLVVVRASFVRGTASWDGAEQNAAPEGSGEVPALSLALAVEDLAGLSTDAPRAGIQLLTEYRPWSRDIGPLPRAKLLADDGEVKDAVGRAVEGALAPLYAAATVEPAGTAEVAPPAGPQAPAVAIEPPPAGARVALTLAAALPDDPAVAVPPEVAERYEGLVRARLERAGWFVLPHDAFDATFHEVALARGGVFDPVTGARRDDRMTAAVAETRRRLAERYGVGLYVWSGIAQRLAEIEHGEAAWDGVTEPAAGNSGRRKHAGAAGGKVVALSFQVAIGDGSATVTHEGWGGIQLLFHLSGGRFVPVPPEELFRDPARDERAVELAFAGWDGN